MKVLVVGGAGYLGGEVVAGLLRRGHEVMVYDALLYAPSYRRLGDESFYRGDVRGFPQALGTWFHVADAVIWLSGIVGESACRAAGANRTYEINAEAPGLASDHVSAALIPFVFASTSSVYGSSKTLTTEEDPLDYADSLYAASKVAGESAILEIPNAVVLRFGTLFGASISRFRNDLVVNRMTADAFTSGRISMVHPGAGRPLVHVRDAAEACVNALDVRGGGCFNIASWQGTIQDIAGAVHEVAGKAGRLPVTVADDTPYPAPTRPRDLKMLANHDHPWFKDAAGSRSPVTLQEGIRELWAVLESGAIADPFDPIWNNAEWLARQPHPLAA